MDKIIPSDVQASLASFEKTLTSLENSLTPFFQETLKEQQSQLEPLDCAKLNVTMAYAINTLFYMYLKTQGIETEDHPVKSELERVRNYIKKIKDISSAPTIRLNTGAANRFIKHALNGNSSSPQKKKVPIEGKENEIENENGEQEVVKKYFKSKDKDIVVVDDEKEVVSESKGDKEKRKSIDKPKKKKENGHSSKGITSTDSSKKRKSPS
eukprot:TRINITY_DN1503_c0_g1_i1.p1 TRINITY_DN1503_c0_g1~~TRINITY_DN1503_c0_g1_i1.p1  ORF type:complete len:211 (-),score=44.87 TRINITY_DN1503_c0_g1_i1:106-738(-)